jgi:hypothetical protein
MLPLVRRYLSGWRMAWCEVNERAVKKEGM